MLLFDTHVWIWSVELDLRRIGRRARQTITRAELQTAVRVSPVSLLELTALHTAGRVRLSRRPESWIREALEVPGVRIAELTPAIAIDAGSIPHTALPDPVDRLLVATARLTDATLLTNDRRILDYAAMTRNVRVQDGAR